jgi:hypothetical protein
MAAPVPSTLEDAIRHAGEGWLIDWFAPPERAMDHLREMLHQVGERARERFGNNAPNFSEEALVAEYRRSPSRVRAFFEALGGTRTPDMLVMAWRIIQGMEIKEIGVSYRRREAVTLRVVLQSPYGEEDAPYESSNIHDFALLRHVGVHEVSGRPVFDGFYALKPAKPAAPTQ